ncbi:MAG: methyl-accepting chemotaxis protein, partial [bacterium]
RKRYLIDNLQYRLIFVSLFYFLAVVLLFAVMLFVPVMFELKSGTLSAPAVERAAHEFLVFHARLWPPIVLLTGLLVFHSIIVSHRIAGPLYRFRYELKKIGDGNLFVHVKLRKNDYLTKEADAINQMVESLRSKIRKIEQDQKSAHGVLVELQRAAITGSADAVNDGVEELAGIIDSLQQDIEQFQLPRTITRVPEKPVEKTVENGEQKSPAETAPVGNA